MSGYNERNGSAKVNNHHHHDEENGLLSTADNESKPVILNNLANSSSKVTVSNVTPAQPTPPDGGFRAWLVMIASFFCNGIIFGVINTYGVMYVKLNERLKVEGDDDASLKVSLVGSLAVGTTFCFSPVAGVLTDRFGLQRTALLGGVLATAGMLASSFCTDQIELLWVTYGIMFGTGASLAYTPSLVILGHYFRRYMGLVNGFVTAGSSIFTIIMPYVMDALLSNFGVEGCLRSLSGMMSLLILCGFVFVPRAPPPSTTTVSRSHTSCKSSCSACCNNVINTDIWRNKKYVVWSLAIPAALFGYFVPYVHLVQYVKDILPNEDGKELVLCIGITSGLGRLIFGKIADFRRVNRIRLQQISFVSIGTLTILLPFFKSFPILIAISLGMGLFDGCFISLLVGASQAIGFLLGLCSIPLTTGPPVAGILYDHYGSYTLAFVLAGIPPIVGALLMFLLDRVGSSGPADVSEQVEDPLSVNEKQPEIEHKDKDPSETLLRTLITPSDAETVAPFAPSAPTKSNHTHRPDECSTDLNIDYKSLREDLRTFEDKTDAVTRNKK